MRVEGVGKIGPIFAGRGVTGEHPMQDNSDGMRIVRDLLGGSPAGSSSPT